MGSKPICFVLFVCLCVCFIYIFIYFRLGANESSLQGHMVERTRKAKTGPSKLGTDTGHQYQPQCPGSIYVGVSNCCKIGYRPTKLTIPKPWQPSWNRPTTKLKPTNCQQLKIIYHYLNMPNLGPLAIQLIFNSLVMQIKLLEPQDKSNLSKKSIQATFGAFK